MRIAVIAVILAIVPMGAVEAQNRRHSLVAAAELQLATMSIGFHGHYLRPHRVGYFIAIRRNLGDWPYEDDIYDNISRHLAEDVFGDEYLGDGNHTWTFAVGINREVGPHVAVFVGPGIVSSKTFREYYDDTHILGDKGHYWIEDGGSSELKPSLIAGILAYAENGITFSLSYQLEPSGIAFGLGYRYSIFR